MKLYGISNVEELYQDDTRAVTAPNKVPRKSEHDHDIDGRVDNEWHFDHNINDTKADEEMDVVRPTDPIFRKPGFNRRDRKSEGSSKTPVWAIMTEPIKWTIQGDWTEFVPSSHVKFLE